MSEMQIETEELEDYKLKVTYVADNSVVNEKNSEALVELRKLTKTKHGPKVSGFRPGKATDLALKVKFKDRIEQWVKAEMVTHANDDIVFETKIRPLGQPQINAVSLNGSNFKLEVIYNKKPEFELAAYKGIDIPSPHLEKNLEEKVNEFLQALREKHADVRPYEDEDFVQEGDKVTLEYELSTGEKEEGKLYEVGSKLFPEFDEALFGMTAGETREFDLLINDKRVNCKTTVHMGLKSVPCPLDETLAQRCGVASIDEVNSSVKTIAENHIKAEKNEKLANQVRLQLLEANKFDPPQWLVNQESEHVARAQGLVFADLNDEARDKVVSEALDNVRFTLILDSIRKDEAEVELADAEAIEGVRQSLEQRGVQDIASALQQLQATGSLFGYVEKMKNDYVVQWIIDNAKVIE